MAPQSGKSSAPLTRESTTTMEEHPQAKGPHPGYVSASNQYTFEQVLRRMLKENGSDPAREDNYRLQGVQLIDTVREHLQLYVLPSTIGYGCAANCCCLQPRADV